MGSKAIEDLPLAGPTDGSELLHVVQGGSSRALPLAAIPGGGGAAAALPRRLSYGIRSTSGSSRAAIAFASTFHTTIVGFAAYAGISGGNGFPVYYVDNESLDPQRANSFFWALAQAEAAGGAIICIDPDGHYNFFISSRVRIDYPNLTIVAPGRNATFWCSPRAGGFLIDSVNIIFGRCEFRTLPGSLSTDNVGGSLGEMKLMSVDPLDADKIAFASCEFRHASDGACDWSTTLLPNGSAPCRGTVQDCIFWSTDQAMLLGANDLAAVLGDPVVLSLTLYRNIFAYCGERQPKVLGRTFVDMVECYTLTLPFWRDNAAPVSEFGACYGLRTLLGGRARARGCLWSAASGNGYAAVKVDATYGPSAVEAIDSIAEDAMTIEAVSTASIPAVPYALPHEAVPAAGPARDAWVADLWATAGARIDAAPEGQFLWTAAVDAYPDGETVLVERGAVGRWRRVDSRAEIPSEGARDPLSKPALTLPRGLNVVVAADAITVDPTRSFITVTPEAGTADAITTINGEVDGRVLVMRPASAAHTLTLTPGGNIDIADSIVLTGRTFAVLLYDTGSARWSVLSSAEKVNATVAAALAGKLSVIDWPGSPDYKLTAGLDGLGCWSGIDGGPQAWLDASDPNGGYVAGGTEDSSRIWSVGAWQVATSRFAIGGSHPYEFAQVPYVGADKVCTEATVKAGTYAPAVTATANCSTLSVTSARYSRVGNVVTVSARIAGTYTAANTMTNLEIALPVGSNIAAGTDVMGVCVNASTAPVAGYVGGSPTTDRALCGFVSGGVAGGAFTLNVVFQYTVI